jgi:GT2 family glycosyltransferase
MLNSTYNEPSVAVVVLNYNGRHYLQRFLPYIQATTYTNKSIWVIDNASTDDSVTILQQKFPYIGVVTLKENYGFAEGYNRGLQHIEADYYILLNSDAEVTPGFIEPVIRLMEKNHRIAFAQPKLLDFERRNMFEYAGAAGGFIDLIGYPFCRGRVLETLEEDTGQYNTNIPIFWASGCCLFARAEVYKELNGFYPFMYMQNEDIDLCWRAQNHGYEVWACGASVVYHMGGGSLSWSHPQKTFYTFRNNLVMLARNMPIAQLLWVIPLRLLIDSGVAIRYLAIGKPSYGFATWKGILALGIWLVKPVDGKWIPSREFKRCAGTLHKIIPWLYFVKKQKQFNDFY